jgi:hypothetical protein
VVAVVAVVAVVVGTEPRWTRWLALKQSQPPIRGYHLPLASSLTKMGKKKVLCLCQCKQMVTTLGSGEVVDARTVQCVVGRVKDRNRWWIIDRSSELAYPLFT